MCDFREYTGKAIDKVNNEEISIPFKGYAAANKQIQEALLYFNGPMPIAHKDSADFGVYYVCATGAGFSYCNGDEWESCYDNERYIFLFTEDKCHHDLSL